MEWELNMEKHKPWQGLQRGDAQKPFETNAKSTISRNGTVVNTLGIGREAGSPSGTPAGPMRRSVRRIGATHATAHLAPRGGAEAERH